MGYSAARSSTLTDPLSIVVLKYSSAPLKMPEEGEYITESQMYTPVSFQWLNCSRAEHVARLNPTACRKRWVICGKYSMQELVKFRCHQLSLPFH
jgi:hypothetical protein